MTDKLSTARRSENMRRIKSKGMKPELLVRSIVHGIGFRYALHRKDLPGKPDMVFALKKKIIFVHGCFWHGHRSKHCVDGHLPKSNLEYWVPKIAGNRKRDARNRLALKNKGWKVLEIWECETKDLISLRKKIRKFLGRRVPRDK